MKKRKVGLIVGSLRKNAFSQSVAEAILELAPSNLDIEIVEIGHLPLYNQDFDANYPEEYIEFKNKIKSLDGVIFITPEHNRSIPAALKNALDIASRPAGQGVWSGKAGGVISNSPGGLGGFGANHHLRQILVLLNVLMVQQPECYLSNITQSIDANNKITAEGTRKILKSFLDTFSDWVELIASGKNK